MPDLRPVPVLPHLRILIRLRQALLLQTVRTVREILFTRGLVLLRPVLLILYHLARLTVIVPDAVTDITSLTHVLPVTMCPEIPVLRIVCR